MRRDSWREKTVPSRRVGRNHRGTGDHVRSDMTTIPARVWVLGLVVLLLTLTVCGLWALYLLRGQGVFSGPTPTPIIWTPTSVPTSADSSTPLPTEVAGPTPTVSPDIAIGRYVRVTGTGGYGLSLRAGPGEGYARMGVALEGEVFIVVDGPTVAGGSQWWKIRDRESEEREWWAIGNFLEPIEHP